MKRKIEPIFYKGSCKCGYLVEIETDQKLVKRELTKKCPRRRCKNKIELKEI